MKEGKERKEGSRGTEEGRGGEGEGSKGKGRRKNISKNVSESDSMDMVQHSAWPPVRNVSLQFFLPFFFILLKI